VVEDVPHHHRAFWFAPGTRWKNDPREHGEVRFLDRDWELEDLILEGGVLSFAFPETAYAVLLRMDATGTFTHHYVNIQSPLRRWTGGFDYTDWFLDVRIPIDRSTYEWKDEDELAEAVRRGLVTEAEAHGIHWAGERAIEHVLLREPPFDRDWLHWRPDPAWEPPSLAQGWARTDGADAHGR
jgi:predicted RNA-binding protein associated with RNAse of E/G family